MKSNSPAEGGRRARLAAERLAHRTAPRDAEVLDTSLPEGQRLAAPLIDPNTGSFTAVGAPGRGITVPVPGTGSVPVNRPGPERSTQAGPNTTELTIIRGRRAAAPQTSRRRFELAIGRSLTNRKVWAGGVVVALVALVPVASMLYQRSTVTVKEADLTGTGTDLNALQQDPDPTNVTVKPDATEVTAYAKEKADAAADAAAKKAARTAAVSTPKTKTKTTSAQPPRASGGQIANLSGLSWRSGVYMPGDKPSNAAAFGNWRGAAVDVIVTWPARQSWDDVINPHWMLNAWKGTPYTKVFGVAPIPEGVNASMASCAAGSYNSKWTEFGQNIQRSGMADESIIRLGWEFNGDWYKWSADNPGQWAECWRQIVGTVKKEAPKLRFDWNVNRGRGTSVVDAADAYPGDAYVDIVGIDSYDSYPGVTSEANWQKQYSGPYGLKHWADFARAHGKKLSVPEWGVYPGTAHADNNGGDNAFYITKMRGFFAEQGSRLAYEAYFNEDDSYYAGSIFSPVQNPIASSKYKALFSN